MSTPEGSFLTGKSAFCVSDWQMKEARSLIEGDDEGGRRILAAVLRAEAELTRNEQAALAFLLIDRLLDSNR
jgi:hypothetical protein